MTGINRNRGNPTVIGVKRRQSRQCDGIAVIRPQYDDARGNMAVIAMIGTVMENIGDSVINLFGNEPSKYWLRRKWTTSLT